MREIEEPLQDYLDVLMPALADTATGTKAVRVERSSFASGVLRACEGLGGSRNVAGGRCFQAASVPWRAVGDSDDRHGALARDCDLLGSSRRDWPGRRSASRCKPPVVPQYGTAEHLGVASCASSTCHGSAVAAVGGNVLLDEAVTWLEQDKHARFSELQKGELWRKITRNLGVDDNAKIYLDCHTDNVPEERRGEKFQLSDGVGCEACHGGSQNWIGVHTVSDDANGHARNVAAGLFPDRRPEGPGTLVSVVPFRRREQVCRPPHHGCRPPPAVVRARHLHPDRAGPLRCRRRLPHPQARRRRGPDLGHRPGHGAVPELGVPSSTPSATTPASSPSPCCSTATPAIGR